MKLFHECLFQFYRYDGSGSHKTIAGNADTKSLIHVCFGVTYVNKRDGTQLWTAVNHRGDNSPKNVRPWSFLYASEENEVLQRLQPELEKEVTEVGQGLEFTLDNEAMTRVQVDVTTSRFSMLDGTC